MCRREDGEVMEGNNAALCTLTIHLNRNTEIPKKRIDVVSEVMKPSSSVFVNRGRDENARTGPVQSSPLLVAGITCWHEHDREMIHKAMIRSQSTNGSCARRRSAAMNQETIMQFLQGICLRLYLQVQVQV